MPREPSALFVATYPPELCGIATFTLHLANAVDQAVMKRLTRVAAISRTGTKLRYDARVVHEIDNTDPDCYRRAARFINDSDADVLCLQHEYGLFRGDWGDQVAELLRECRKPVVSTLHTILPEPTDKQREVLREIAEHSARVVVMAEAGVRLLESVYDVPAGKVQMIPHGVPEVTFHHRPLLRQMLGLQGREVVMTFGLLSSGKGIQYMIEALPAIRAKHPKVLYVLIGQTHPAIKARDGESYRESLLERARQLGVSDCVRFENRYVTDDELVLYLQSCDVHVTPYIGRDQITSGTLSYAMAAGCATVSTAYIYARELLAEGRGRLADFESSESLATEINAILDDPAYREELQVRSYEFGRKMHWDEVGKLYHQLFARLCGKPASAHLEATDVTLESLINDRRPQRLAGLSSVSGD